jgi:uncharacterized protein YyaL (SSP411 family)
LLDEAGVDGVAGAGGVQSGGPLLWHHRKRQLRDHSHPSPLQNQNVLSVVRPELSADEQKLLAPAKQKMLQARSKRVRPHLDDKVLASWNG